MLRRGGVEITGFVSDISGGPVAHARVRASKSEWRDLEPGPMVETDARGAFALWVKPGIVHVTATADGYSAGRDSGSAPGRFAIALAPEATVAGMVVDGRTNQPLQGVSVLISEADSRWGADVKKTVSDAEGQFFVAQLPAGRYSASVRNAIGYGRSEGSVLAGLGQQVGGLTVTGRLSRTERGSPFAE